MPQPDRYEEAGGCVLLPRAVVLLVRDDLAVHEAASVPGKLGVRRELLLGRREREILSPALPRGVLPEPRRCCGLCPRHLGPRPRVGGSVPLLAKGLLARPFVRLAGRPRGRDRVCVRARPATAMIVRTPNVEPPQHPADLA
jgi:hypothetical protein